MTDVTTATTRTAPPALVRVVVVDDQPLFASGLQMLIEAQADLICVGGPTSC